jgi:hypothetical protein
MEGLLPAIFSKSDEIKRNLKGLLRNPREMFYSLGEDLRAGNEKNQAAYQALLGDTASSEERRAAVEQAAGLATDVIGGGGGLMGNLAVPKRFLEKGAKTLVLPEAGGKMGQVPMEFGALPTTGERVSIGALPLPGGPAVTRALGEVYENPAIAERFPDLQNMMVDLQNVKGTPLLPSGQFNPVEDRISLRFGDISGRTGLLQILDHELGHAVQKREGMSFGSSPRNVGALMQALLDARIKAKRLGVFEDTPAVRELYNKVEGMQEVEGLLGQSPGMIGYLQNPGEVMTRVGQNMRLPRGGEGELAFDIPEKHIAEFTDPVQAYMQRDKLPSMDESMQMLVDRLVRARK